jgi:hypothetical protein
MPFFQVLSISHQTFKIRVVILLVYYYLGALSTDPMRLDTLCVVVRSYEADLTALASIGFLIGSL